MSNVVILIWAFFSFAFTGNDYQLTETVKAETINRNNTFNNLHRLEDIIVNNPYELTLAVKKGKENSLDLIVNIKLREGAFFASPFSNEHLKGYFNISLGEEKNLSMTELLTENPVSEIVIDEFSNNPTRWVTQNTTYIQNLKIETENDFEVLGKIRFVIEPKCTLEEIPFGISLEDGEIKVIQNPRC
jgi:hypothetical protein